VRLGGRPHPRDLPGGPVLAAGQAYRQAGRPPAPWATQVLVIAWYLLSNDCDDHDLGGDWFARRSDHDRRKTHLVRQLQALGYSVTLQPAA
jgi:transposase